MARLKNDQQSKFVLLLWGPAFSGKTVLASQFPNPFFIDLDGQIGAVRALANKHEQNFDFPLVYIDEEHTDDEDFISYCGKNFAGQNAWTKTKKMVETLSRKLPKDSTLVLDNLSRASEYLLTEVKRRANRSQLQIQDWGIFVEEIKILMDYIHSRSSQCNVIMVGHEQTTKEELTGKMLKSLLMPTSAGNRIPSKASDFLYMNVEAVGPNKKRVVKRTLQSIPDPQNPVGSRSLIPNIESPTYEQMRPYLESYIGRSLGEPTWTPPEENLYESE